MIKGSLDEFPEQKRNTLNQLNIISLQYMQTDTNTNNYHNIAFHIKYDMNFRQILQYLLMNDTI